MKETTKARQDVAKPNGAVLAVKHNPFYADNNKTREGDIETFRNKPVPAVKY